MTFRVTVEELVERPGQEPVRIERLKQEVDVIDLAAVFAAVVKPPRKKRERKPKS